jgi:hypothetical protein
LNSHFPRKCDSKLCIHTPRSRYTLSTVEALPIGFAEEPHHPEPDPKEPANELFGGDTWLPEDGHRKGWLNKHWRKTHTHHRQFFILSHQPGRHGLWYYDHHSELDHLGFTAESQVERRDHIAEMGVQPSGIIRTGDIKDIRAGLEPTRIEVVCSSPKRGGKGSVERVLVLEAGDTTDAFAWLQ